MSCVIDHDIVGLEISVDYVVRVQPLESNEYLCKIKAHAFFSLCSYQLQIRSEQAVQILPFDVLER